MDLNKYEADELTKEIDMCLSQLEDDILYLKDKVLEAYDGRIWLALKFKSWEAYVKATFSLPKLPVDTRRALTAELAENLPTRAIATIEGVSTWTVRNDSKEQVGGNLSPADPAPKSETKIGLDGKKYPKSGSKPHPQLPPVKLEAAADAVSLDSNTLDLARAAGKAVGKLQTEIMARPPVNVDAQQDVLKQIRIALDLLNMCREVIELNLDMEMI